jgi:hypothetical protein
MTFDPAALLDNDKMKNGPLAVVWNQEGWIEPNKPLDKNGGYLPKRKLRHRLLRLRPWRVEIRLAPPPDVDLSEWGNAIAATLGFPFSTPEEGDSVLWMWGGSWARNAGGALGGAGKFLRQLEGHYISAGGIRVSRWEDS